MTNKISQHKQSGPGLSAGAISTFGIVVMVLAFSGPLIGLTGAMPSAMVTGNGNGAPVAYVVVGVILLVFAVGFIAMSGHVTNAGALYAYVGRGLGLPMGVASASVALWAYTAIQVAVYAFFGVVSSGTLAMYTGLELPWYVLSIALILLVQVFGYLRIELGMKVLLLVMVLEWGIMLLLAVAILASGGAGEGFGAAEVWGPSAVLTTGFPVALIWAFASMAGLESSAIYGEETKNPRKSVSRAAVISVVSITAFFAFTGWMAIVGYGPSQSVNQALAALEGGDPAQYIFQLGGTFLGSWAPVMMSLFVITSMFACVLAFHNGIARYQYRLGKDGVLPRGLSRTRANGAPHVSSVVQCSTALLFIVIGAILGVDPVTVLFFWGGGIAVVGLVAMYVLTSVSVIVFFRKNPGLNGNVWSTTIFPILAIILLVVSEYLIVMNFDLLIGTDQRTSFLVAGTSIVAFIVGLGIFLARRRQLSADALFDLEAELT